MIDLPACDDLEAGDCTIRHRSRWSRLAQWFLEMDQKIQVHQLRQFLQTTSLTSEEGLQTLLEHHLYRETAVWIRIATRSIFCWSNIFPIARPRAWKTPTWIWLTWPRCWSRCWEAWILTLPSWLHPLDDFIQAADACRSLNQLLTSGTLEKGRKLKISVDDNYFEPVAMVAFTRFSFLMRRVFFRLMHQDLNTILDGLRELETRGVEHTGLPLGAIFRR